MPTEMETTLSGLLLFGRYAYPPNLLGYCGSDDHAALGAYLEQGSGDAGLTELARTFDGAYPYLRLIAAANGLSDPFDPRVVEAYWIGNPALERVAASSLYRSLEERFRPRMKAREFSWLTTSLELGAKPHHNFHVFDIYRRAGLMRDGHATVALDRMDRCRISWGKVLLVDGTEVVVARRPLELAGGKLRLGLPREQRLARRPEEPLEPGDAVAIHWDWVCERLSGGRLARLAANTRRAVANTNATL